MSRLLAPFAAMLITLSLIVPAASPALAQQGEPVLLTVTGAIKTTNRGPFDPFRDSLFETLKETFKAAFAFDRAALLALPQATITTKYPNWPTKVTARGPLLKDVLAAVGADGNRVRVQALDGYAPEFTMADITAGTVVLALEADGQPLSIGGRGPLWLVFPPNSIAGQSTEDDSGLAWAVFHLAVDSSK
ncbi:MAG: hypothetical protein HQ481_12680 [Alphaproteobacteria bacterium]|nr:hypothetical protein [Alphaproteobacteria bacterium]